MRMLYRLMPFLFGMIMLIPLFLKAQDEIKPLPKQKDHKILDRIDFGGYLGATFGDVTYVEVSPLASYRITPKFHAGLGLTYMYYNSSYYHHSSNSYGGSIFARYFVWKDLFVHFEYAPLYVSNPLIPPGTPIRVETHWAQDILVGGGYRQWIGDKAFMSLMLLWNLNETYLSPYINPIFRIGFGVGF